MINLFMHMSVLAWNHENLLTLDNGPVNHICGWCLCVCTFYASSVKSLVDHSVFSIWTNNWTIYVDFCYADNPKRISHEVPFSPPIASKWLKRSQTHISNLIVKFVCVVMYIAILNINLVHIHRGQNWPRSKFWYIQKNLWIFVSDSAWLYPSFEYILVMMRAHVMNIFKHIKHSVII